MSPRSVPALFVGLLLLTGPLLALPASALPSGTGGVARVSAVTPSTPLPGKDTWYADVRKAMKGSQVYVDHRVADGAQGLAVNLDIDNTSIATHYNHMKPIPVMMRFVTHARGYGVAVLFNTGRLQSRLTTITEKLRDDGFDFAEVCGRSSTEETLAHSKERCRRKFVREGYTIIANLGNNTTDLRGGNYEHGIKLPDYGKKLD